MPTKIRTDCRHYRINRPCEPHKRTGVTCDGCVEHDPRTERVLIVKLDAMGDVLRTTACLPALGRVLPNAHVTWITRQCAVPLLAGNPSVHRVLAVESNYLEYLLTERFDMVLAPDADPLSAAIASLARAPVKRGYLADGRGGIVSTNEAADAWWRMGLDDSLKRANRRTYGEWLHAICELPLPVGRPSLHVGPAAHRAAAELLAARAPGAGKRVLFNTGASGRWKEKRWKARHFVEMAAVVRRDEPETTVVLVGGPGDDAFNASLVAEGHMVDGGTDHTVETFGAIVAACEWILTADSLGYHVACAVGTRAVCLVGPTSPWELDVYDTNVVLHADLECIGCYLAECPLPTTCMDALEPSLVRSRLPAAVGVRLQKRQ